MAKNKYETHVLPYLEKIEKWAKEGATSKEIAAKLKIGYSTFKSYIGKGEKGDERYKDLSDAFARACEVPDDNVEAALYKRACGIEYEEVKREQTINRKTGEVQLLETRTIKFIPPDPTSAMFWLTNRRPDRWRYKPEETEESGKSGESGVVLLAPVMDAPEEPSLPSQSPPAAATVPPEGEPV